MTFNPCSAKQSQLAERGPNSREVILGLFSSMMNCPPKALLQSLLASLLPEEEAHSIRGHVLGCARCQSFLEQESDRPGLESFRQFDSQTNDTTQNDPILDDLLRRMTATLRPAATRIGRPAAARSDVEIEETMPPLVGAYRLLEEIGRGGMGIVYRALDESLGRVVALKVVRPERAGEDSDRARLIREARVAARFRNDYVVLVHAVGDPPGGSPYLVMEYIDGPTLADWLTSKPRPGPREIARVVAQIAHGLDSAHHAGLIHRDVKPTNILIERGSGRPKLTDFGLARESGNSGLTREGVLAGTPTYMSPEQVRADPSLDRRTDIYSLGATLYEALVGRPPFTGPTLGVLRRIVEDDPIAPRRLDDTIPRDLETICLKAMAREPARRYQTARDLADDLERCLDGRPISARPVSRWEQAVKWARRRPAVAALLAAVVAVTAVGFVLVSWQWYRATTERRRAETQAELAEARRREADDSRRRERERADAEAAARRQARHSSATLALARAQMLLEQGRQSEALLWIAEGLLAVPEGDLALERALRANWTHARPAMALSRYFFHSFPPLSVVFSPDGQLLASTDFYSSQCRVWDVASGELLNEMPHPETGVAAIAIDPGGSILATGCGTNPGEEFAYVQFWDLKAQTKVGDPLPQEGRVRSMAFSPDGRFLITVSGPSCHAQLWDVAQRKPVGSGWTSPGLRRVAYFPDNKTVLTGGHTGIAERRDARSGAAIGQPLQVGSDILSIAVASDGRTYLLGCADQRVRRVDVSTDQIRVSELLPGAVQSLAISPDDRSFLSGTADGIVRLWDVERLRPTVTTPSHPGAIWGVAFAPDGKSIAATTGDRFLRVWEAAPGDPFGKPFGPAFPQPVRTLTFSPDGRFVVCQAGDSLIQALNGTDGTPVGERGSAYSWFAPIAGGDSASFLVQAERGSLRLWRPQSGTLAGAVIPYRRQDYKLQPAALSPDGRRVATVEAIWGKSARLWDLQTGQSIGPVLEHAAPLLTVAFTPDGKTLLTGGQGMVRLWDAATGAPLGEPLPAEASIAMTVSPDGRRLLATGGWNSNGRVDAAQVWDLERRKPVGKPLGHADRVWAAAFSTDGRTIVAGSDDKTARIWDAETGEPKGLPLHHDGTVEYVALSPDDSTVLTRSLDGKARLWEPESGQLLCPPLAHEGRVLAAAFHHSGRFVLTAGDDGRVRQWTVPTPANGSPDQIRLRSQIITGIMLDQNGQVRTLSGPDWADRREELRRIANRANSGNRVQHD
jgi:WD40 repeat protein/serine/threonine protein kinase